MSKQVLAIEIWRKCLIVKQNNNDTMQKNGGGGISDLTTQNEWITTAGQRLSNFKNDVS